MENPHVRMIVCDVDGTLLLKGEHAISEEVFQTIKTATDAGIEFVIASGRCYQDLKALFHRVANHVTFICSDGALAVKGNDILYSSPIDKKQIETLLSNKNLALILSSKESMYSYNAAMQFDTFSLTSIADINEINTDIYKLSFFALSDFEKQKVKNLALYSAKLTEIYSDPSWTEFVSYGTDKGKAVATLQAQLNITPNETAAFGDNINDFGMLRRARLSFAAPAAIPDIKKMCKYQTNNVTKTILNILRER